MFGIFAAMFLVWAEKAMLTFGLGGRGGDGCCRGCTGGEDGQWLTVMVSGLVFSTLLSWPESRPSTKTKTKRPSAGSVIRSYRFVGTVGMLAIMWNGDSDPFQKFSEELVK